MISLRILLWLLIPHGLNQFNKTIYIHICMLVEFILVHFMEACFLIYQCGCTFQTDEILKSEPSELNFLPIITDVAIYFTIYLCQLFLI